MITLKSKKSKINHMYEISKGNTQIGCFVSSVTGRDCNITRVDPSKNFWGAARGPEDKRFLQKSIALL